jgi:hypothetical protein
LVASFGDLYIFGDIIMFELFIIYPVAVYVLGGILYYLVN